MFTKTQAEIMKVFASEIDKRFSIKEISELLKKPYPLIHRSIQGLLESNFIRKDEKWLLSISYKENHADLAYIESLRSKEAITKDKILSLFIQDVYEKIGLDFFIFLIFGSYIKKNNPRDIDILIIVEDEGKINETEMTISNIAENFTKNFHIQVVSTKSAHEMLAKREKINILNETLNNHLLLFGAESYYGILKNAR